jgi:hypothetical protein
MVAAFVTAGCGGASFAPCFLKNPGASYRLSPSGRAVAFVDPSGYGELTGGRAPSSFACVAQEARPMFAAPPETLVITLNFEHGQVRFLRTVLEHGYDPAHLPNPLPPVVLEAMEADQRRSYPAEKATNAYGVPLPQGLGERKLAADSGQGFGSWVYVPIREDLVGGRFLHELGHNWAAHLTGPSVLAQQIDRFNHHWGASSVGGVLGGWEPGSLVQLGAGRFRGLAAPAGVAVPIRPYAPLELYLMGLARADEVPPIEVAVEPVRFTADGDEFSTSGFRRVTIDDIIEANGPRAPAHDRAPRQLSIALVILAGAEPTASDWEYFERAMDFMTAARALRIDEAFAAERFHAGRRFWNHMEDETHRPLLNFFMATRERATLALVSPRPIESRAR